MFLSHIFCILMINMLLSSHTKNMAYFSRFSNFLWIFPSAKASGNYVSKKVRKAGKIFAIIFSWLDNKIYLLERCFKDGVCNWKPWYFAFHLMNQYGLPFIVYFYITLSIHKRMKCRRLSHRQRSKDTYTAQAIDVCLFVSAIFFC